MKNHQTIFLVLLFFNLTIFLPQTPKAQNAISVENLKKHVSFLASDKLKGRGTSTKQERKAAQYIAKQFAQYGLEPKGIKGFMYPFQFKKSTNPHGSIDSTSPSFESQNVVGFLNNNATNTIIVGAHYDHLGLGMDKNSLDANPTGKIHNGADDNASGTAGMLELARHLTQNNRTERYNYLFMGFSGEELGLLGSKKYCENPTIDLKTVNMMLNLDMIGRLNDSTKRIVVYGVGTAPQFVPLIDSLDADFSIKKDSSGIGPSDQTSFYNKDIPVLHFFTGQHGDYHRPSDDVEKINFVGEAKVLETIVVLLDEIDKLPKLQFLTTRNSTINAPRFKVSMGIMPDYTFEGEGVMIDGVTQGKPASKAGVQKGDMIVELGTFETKSVMQYMEVLSKFRKGDQATLKVKRNNQIINLNVEF